MERSNLFSLAGKVALITGATGGLGSAIVSAMAEAGARLLVSDHDLERCNATVERLQQAGYPAAALSCDLSDPDSTRALASRAEAVWGRVDILVCNAGVQGPAGPLGETTSADWDQVMGINLRSALLLTSAVLPRMASRGGGSVILMSSIAGLRGNKAIGLYGLAKAGLAQLARNLAVEWGPNNIRVNAISPGLIRTPLAAELLENAGFMERRLAMTPLRRVGEPHEIAGVGVMLASAAGAFITGQNLVVDGGTLISDGG
ncbi:SDR family oxidoreductase [Marinobacterium sp. D7]|uniref:SDR family NAD(P)-dependent oxidoreductase n=1 Tax=Marinobacterium ramblicola TaxID=2849041 RepID=UPI001C2DA0D6|nr:SDR family oxidoreductase [Marinobacterium ramblicola]MBV1788683.1 SDR family oxidoreductase [Marinobacterium ramblicola]